MNVRYEKMDGWGACYRDSDSTMALVSENGMGTITLMALVISAS